MATATEQVHEGGVAVSTAGHFREWARRLELCCYRAVQSANWIDEDLSANGDTEPAEIIAAHVSVK